MTEKLRKVRQPREMIKLVLINTAANRVARCDRRLPDDRRNEHFTRGCSEGLPPVPIYNKDG